MKKRYSLLFLTLTIALIASAQTIMPDGAVRFVFDAPQAKVATVVVDEVAHPMFRNANEQWECTLTDLHADLHTYIFQIDGVPTLDPRNPHRMRDIAQTFNFFILPGSEADVCEAHRVKHGTVQQMWYTTQDGRERRMSVYLPPSYYESAQSYPVLYLLHGSGGDELAWLELGRTAEIMDNMIANGTAKEMIVVMPNGNYYQDASPTYYPEASKWSRRDVRLSGQYEENFHTIVTYTEQHFRAIPQKRARAIAGLSMGGYHAMHISHFYADMFDYVGLFSPALSTFHDKNSGTPQAVLAFPVNTNTPRVYRRVEEELHVQFANRPKLYWIGIGTDDFLYAENQQFRTLLDKHKYPYTYHESTGGHTWKNWRAYLPLFLAKIF